MKKTRWVEVFLKGDNTSEVSAELVQTDYDANWLFLVTKDEDGGQWSYVFPQSEVRMVRLSDR